MYSIFIASHCMEIGGAERSLLGLLNSFDCDKYSIDLFLYRHQGELLNMLPEEVRLLPQEAKYSTLARPIRQILKEGHVDIGIARLIGKFASALYYKIHKKAGDSGVGIEYSHKYTRKLMPPIQKNMQYDLAISYLTPHYFVAEKVKAKKKVAWIHTDYNSINIDVKSEFKMWSKYDYIASVSESCNRSFLERFPALREKIINVENIVSPQFTKAQAELLDVTEEMPKEGDTINILSVGRFAYAKNFDNVPAITRKILEHGISVKWYLIGFGADEKLIREKIAEAKVEGNVIVLGKKVNPYPYIKACDIYVQPSRYEGKAVTVKEAQILCKPVIITDFPTSQSQLNNGFDGLIVPLDNDRCAKEIYDLIINKDRQKVLTENCSRSNYGNEKEVEKLYKLLS